MLLKPLIQAGLMKIWADREQYRTDIGLSQMASGCNRALWAVHNQIPRTNYPTPSQILRWEFGRAGEQIIIDALKAVGVTTLHTQTELDFLGVKGHTDGAVDLATLPKLEDSPFELEPIQNIFDTPEGLVLLEAKTASNTKFIRVRSNGVEETFPQYFSQVQNYFAGWRATFGEPLVGAVVVILNLSSGALNKDGSEVDAIYEEVIYEVPGMAEAQTSMVVREISSTEPPARPFATPKNDKCLYCSHRDWCWEKS